MEITDFILTWCSSSLVMIKASKDIASRRVLSSFSCLDVSTLPGWGALDGEQLFLCPILNDILTPIHTSVTKTANENYTLFLNRKKCLPLEQPLICFETFRQCDKTMLKYWKNMKCSKSLCNLLTVAKPFIGFFIKFYTQIVHKNYCTKVSLVKTESVVAILYLRAHMKFNLYLSHISTAFSKIRYRRFTFNATEQLWVLLKSVQWKPHVILGRRQTFPVLSTYLIQFG